MDENTRLQRTQNDVWKDDELGKTWKVNKEEQKEAKYTRWRTWRWANTNGDIGEWVGRKDGGRRRQLE